MSLSISSQFNKLESPTANDRALLIPADANEYFNVPLPLMLRRGTISPIDTCLSGRPPPTKSSLMTPALRIIISTQYCIRLADI